MRSLILAVQFLTRIPTPQLRDFDPAELARCAPWFPWVGALVGLAVAAATQSLAGVDAWVAALAGLLVWVWITGALHLDGMADLADGLGAAHRDPSRLLAVMRDPHLGVFGVVSLVMQLLCKLVLLHALLGQAAPLWWALPLIAAWARWGALLWSAYLPALAGSSTERFTWAINRPVLALNALLLLALSAWLCPPLLLAPLPLLAWGVYLKRRLGGMTGDCLGAGIELTETALLLALLLQIFFNAGIRP